MKTRISLTIQWLKNQLQEREKTQNKFDKQIVSGVSHILKFFLGYNYFRSTLPFNIVTVAQVDLSENKVITMSIMCLK